MSETSFKFEITEARSGKVVDQWVCKTRTPETTIDETRLLYMVKSRTTFIDTCRLVSDLETVGMYWMVDPMGRMTHFFRKSAAMTPEPGTCPTCGDRGSFIRMALTCPTHGVFGGC